VPRQHIEALISYATTCATWLEQDVEQARRHGHEASPEQLEQLAGYRFTALFLTESYDLV